MSGPYRALAAPEVLEAPAREGRARLEVAPDAALLEVGDRLRIAVTDAFVTLERRDRRRRRRRSLRLSGTRLLVARAYPTGGVGLWFEEQPGVMRRLAGLSTVEMLDADGLAGVRKLERLAGRLRAVLQPLGRGAVAAAEFGAGQHRVLLIDDGARYELFARPLFRERPRKVLEVSAGGEVVATTRRGHEARTRSRSRFDVTVRGDRIRFADRRGRDRAGVILPWIARADREELARRFGERVDQGEVPVV